MNEKGSMELSVRAIVILIIGLTVLGLVIGFTAVKFSGFSEKISFTQATPAPTPDKPIQVPGGKDSFQIPKNSQVEMEIRLYNSLTLPYESEWTNASVLICSNKNGILSFYPQLPSTAIMAGGEGDIPILFALDKSVQKGIYACQLIFKSKSYYECCDALGEPYFVQGDPIGERYMKVEVQ